ncbi:unnamed protein product [Didymodactylos carnosus]|uniref:Uncharacterized protein n=1 Tax=Didymodactylos carnosus TaxID=1234261 RepID=A0A8S2HVE7_9BILA|nr:unnamed protein product [Didymodactylos carnosus]CAF3665377.1 unnamed protein product [Didymodactylos carnosus]
MAIRIALLDPARTYEHKLSDLPVGGKMIRQFHNKNDFLRFMYHTPLNSNDETVSFILPEAVAQDEVTKLQQYISSSQLSPVNIYVYRTNDTSTVNDGGLQMRRTSFTQESLYGCNIVRDIFDESQLMEKLQDCHALSNEHVKTTKENGYASLK